MALVIEDGTGKTDAEAYISVANADTYFSNRGNAVWAALTTTQKEQALRKATDYMLGMYRSRWKGYRNTTTQALDWPRSEVDRPDAGQGYGFYPSCYATNVVPSEVVNACAELAVRVSAADIWPDISPADMAKAVSVGPISIEYKDYAPVITLFRAVEARLAPFFRSNGLTAQVVRT